MTDVMVIRAGGYEGPFDLLLQLIEKNKIDIRDIPIALVLDQFLEHAALLPRADMELTGRFIVFAAALLEIKSQMLLPGPDAPEDDCDPREALVRGLLEYKRFKEAAARLAEDYERGCRRFFRGPEFAFKRAAPPDWNQLLGGLSRDRLFDVFTEVCLRREERADKAHGGFDAVSRDMFTIEEKAALLRQLLLRGADADFSELMARAVTPAEKIATFLALLELVKSLEIVVFQDGVFGKITCASCAAATCPAP